MMTTVMPRLERPREVHYRRIVLGRLKERKVRVRHVWLRTIVAIEQIPLQRKEEHGAVKQGVHHILIVENNALFVVAKVGKGFLREVHLP